MNRRLLGPVGGPIVFFLVVALVFAGLGWVTYSALAVEQAQRDAAARAELGNNLRAALWRLDGRMLPTLGVEDSRPFYHYAPADPAAAFGQSATPLLAANLPDWMKLHFQLDPTLGWDSPQVLPGATADRVRTAWPDPALRSLALRNLNGPRETFLNNGVKEKFPVQETCELFAARDRAIPADSLPLAAPFFTGENYPQQTEPTPNPSPLPPAESTPKPPPPTFPVQGFPPIHPKPNLDTFRLLGIDLCLRPDQPLTNNTNNQTVGNGRPETQGGSKLNDLTSVAPKAPVPGVSQTMVRGGNTRGAQKDAESERLWTDFMNRAQVWGKGLQEAKQAGGDPLGRNPYSQNSIQNSLDLKYGLGNSIVPQLPAMPGPGGPTLTPQVPVIPGDDKSDKNGKATQEKAEASTKLAEAAKAVVPESQLRDTDKAKADERDRLTALQQADDAAWFRWFLELRDQTRRAAELRREPGITPPKPRPGDDEKAGQAVPPPANPEKVGEDRPPVVISPIPPVAPPQLLPPAVHLGSMRPQWVTAPDGSEMLVLVRATKFDNKTVYQGVILDWERLQAALKDEVRDIFPDAQLVAVRDPDNVSPDRAMIALPVQLDPGPEPTLAPTGWTPLRFGLLMAWAAAVIAFAAVGFCGWSLIDLAERRIRFVSAVTHELRTPLTSLRLYLDMLVSGMIQDEAKRQEYLHTLATESDRLHRLVDNVLDFAKLEKRRKDGDIKPVKVGELLEQLRQTWTDRIAPDGKELVVISTLTPEQLVRTDAAMVQQIVGNLIDNARKYTRGVAEPRIWLWAKPGVKNTVLIEVEDRGPGVPVSERRTIFKPFRRGEHADSIAGGAGLGLALAKSWAEVLGAKLTYRPADGGTGACFRLELPATS